MGIVYASFLSLTLSLTLCLALSGCREEPSGSTVPGRRHILLITVEGLRADSVGAYAPWFAPVQGDPGDPTESPESVWSAGMSGATPHVDRWAQGALVYGYALATSSWCAPSLGSLHAGRYPSELAFTDLSEPLDGDAHTLAEVLNRRGWRTRALVEHPFLQARHNLDQGFDEYRLMAGESAQQRSEKTVAAAQKAIRQMGAQSTFLWVQLGGLGPPYASASDEAGSGELSRSDWLRYRDHWQPEDLAYLRAQYLGQVQRVDQQIGLLLDTLQKRDAAQDTIVVVTSTNGCELLERGMLGDGVSLHSDQTRVPLFVAIPGERSGSITEPVSLVDVAPTLLRLVGLSAPDSWSGVSALPMEPIPARTLFAELSRARYQRVALRGDHKLIWDLESDRAWLYDVFADPQETNNLADQKGALRRELWETLQGWETPEGTAQSD